MPDLLDLGDDNGLFYTQYREPIYDRGLEGEEIIGQFVVGWRVTTEAFIRNVLHAEDSVALGGMTLRPSMWLPAPEPITVAEPAEGWAS